LFQLPLLRSGIPIKGNICVKPLDYIYYFKSTFLYRTFDKFIWITRDPRDAYLSAFEIGYAYIFWLPGKKERGIDLGQLKRWKLIYQHFFTHRNLWYLIKYERLVSQPDETLKDLFNYLEIPAEKVYPFKRFKWFGNGDPKLTQTTTLHSNSVMRHKAEMSKQKQEIFFRYLSKEMAQLGYGS
jgi:hypothetical protein